MPMGKLYRPKRRKPKVSKNVYRVVKKMIQNQQEIKVHDKEFDGSACSQIAAAIDATYLTAIAQGDGDGERIGDNIHVKSIYIKGFAQQTAAQVSAVRIIIFRDMDQSGANEPTTSDLLRAVTNLNSGIDKSEQAQKRFIVLSDELMECNDTGPGAYAQIKYYKEFKKPLIVRFSGADATTASAGSGSLWMLYLTDVGASHPTLGLNVRLRYYG